MSNLLIDFGKFWLEWRGRSQTAQRYLFQANEILTEGSAFKVSFWKNGVYINLHPTHYAVVVGPDGRLMNLRGGYNRLAPGRYLLHYVDKQNRVGVVPLTAETTFDGSQVSLELIITYRVIDPIKALEVQNAVDTLLAFIKSDLKEFIRSHRYDEIVGDLNGRKIENARIANYIKDQHASRHQMSRLFFLADIVIEEKIGDRKVTEIRENFQIQQRQNFAESELLKQNQELERKVTDQQALINRLKAEAEANEQKIRQAIEIQKIELETARTELYNRQAKWAKAMEAISQALSSQVYPLDAHAFEIIHDLLKAMGTAPEQGSASGQENRSGNGSMRAGNPEQVDELTNTLLSWLARKRSS